MTTQVVMVGAGACARRWAEVIEASPALELVALVARLPVDTAWSVPSLPSLEDALAQFPAARFLVALPPVSALEAAQKLAQAGRTAVVEAPLPVELAQSKPGTGEDQVRIAHGYVTLPGRSWCERLLASRPFQRAVIEVRGLPEVPEGDPAEVLSHGLALVRSLFPSAKVERAAQLDRGLFEVALSSDLVQVQLRAMTSGRRLKVALAGAGLSAEWSWDGQEEVVVFAEPGQSGKPSGRPAEAAEVRAVRQLFDGPASGDTLAEARDVARLTQDAMDALPPLPFGRRGLRSSRSIAAHFPSRPLLPFGLEGELPDAAPLDVATPVLLLEPSELWMFRAGIKPVAFLTLKSDEVDAAVAPFGEGIHVERRERRVQVGAQDRWTDQRDLGEPMVGLYISRDSSLARRAAEVQAEKDPTKQVQELGELMGYPKCCVDAFLLLEDRANNTGNRYASHARSPAEGPWPWELNNLHYLVLPYYPCSYACEPAVQQARAAIAEMNAAHPGVADRLRDLMGRPVLYFDHDHQIVIEGDARDTQRTTVRSAKLGLAADLAFARAAAAITSGAELRLEARQLEIHRDGVRSITLRRTDPMLGILAPFGGS